jgi:hypothetical protein
VSESRYYKAPCNDKREGEEEGERVREGAEASGGGYARVARDPIPDARTVYLVTPRRPDGERRRSYGPSRPASPARK